MALPRCIPVLLLQNGALVKTVRFRDPKYIGDPLNAVRIFNEKEADELIFLDIDASVKSTSIPLDLLKEIAEECFMPLSFGGGIRSIEDIRTVIQNGVEKVVIGTQAVENPGLLKEAIQEFGSSTICVSLDVCKTAAGYKLVIRSGSKETDLDPVEFAKELDSIGVGEILIHSVDRDGMMGGYDLEIIRKISDAVTIPVIACGGAGTLEDLDRAINEAGASAVAAGSMFVFHGKHKAVLISYPEPDSLKRIYSNISGK